MNDALIESVARACASDDGFENDYPYYFKKARAVLAVPAVARAIAQSHAIDNEPEWVTQYRYGSHRIDTGHNEAFARLRAITGDPQ